MLATLQDTAIACDMPPGTAERWRRELEAAMALDWLVEFMARYGIPPHIQDLWGIAHIPEPEPDDWLEDLALRETIAAAFELPFSIRSRWGRLWNTNPHGEPAILGPDPNPDPIGDLTDRMLDL